MDLCLREETCRSVQKQNWDERIQCELGMWRSAASGRFTGRSIGVRLRLREMKIIFGRFADSFHMASFMEKSISRSAIFAGLFVCMAHLSSDDQKMEIGH
jgi:hypothetical protein